MNDQQITIRYNDRNGTYSFSPEGVEQALEAITGPVGRGPWAHAVGEALKGGRPVTLAELAASITAANQRLLAARAKKGIRRVTCNCGHECDSNLVLSASRGSSCPDCYDRMSE
jgi:hypothetical protein